MSCCVLLAQLMTHLDIYTLPFTLHLCYKPPGIMQRVTKSQKFHISSHDYKHFIPPTLVNMSQGFPRRLKSSWNLYVIKTLQNCYKNLKETLS